MESDEIDYKVVNEVVDNCMKLYPDIDKYVLWVMACDWYLKDVLKKEFDHDENNELFEKCKEELKTRTYEGVKVVDVSQNDVSENLIEDLSSNDISGNLIE